MREARPRKEASDRSLVAWTAYYRTRLVLHQPLAPYTRRGQGPSVESRSGGQVWRGVDHV
jgi:hypothetical protein